MKKTIVALVTLGVIVASCSQPKKPITLNNTQLSIVLPDGVEYKDTCVDRSDYIFEKGSKSKYLYIGEEYYKSLEAKYQGYKNTEFINKETFDNGVEIITYHPENYKTKEPDTTKVKMLAGLPSNNGKLIGINFFNTPATEDIITMLKSIKKDEKGNLTKTGLNITLANNYEVACREEQDELFISNNLTKVYTSYKSKSTTIQSVIDGVKGLTGVETIEEFKFENGIQGLATQYKNSSKYELHGYLFQDKDYVIFKGKADSLNQIETFKGILEGVQINTKE